MVTEIFLQLVVLLLMARLGGLIASKLKQSAVLGEILAGAVAGPYILGIFNPSSPIFMEGIAQVGIVLMMFLVGLHINVKNLKKFLGKGAFVALLGVIFPLAFGAIFGFYYGWTSSASYLLGAALMATSVGITTAVLTELKKLNTEAGAMILDAAVIDDVYGVVVLGILIGVVASNNSLVSTVAGLSLKIALFFAVVIFFGRNISQYVVLAGKHLNLRVEEGFLSIILIFVFTVAYFADIVGLSPIVGAFLVGLVLGKDKLRELGRVEHEIYGMAYGFFIPIFFAFVGTGINPAFIFANLPMLGLLFAIAIFTKLFGCGIASRLVGLSLSDSFIVGVGMIPRLEVATIIVEIGRRYSIITTEQFSILMATIALTILATPPLLTLSSRLTKNKESTPLFAVPQLAMADTPARKEARPRKNSSGKNKRRDKT